MASSELENSISSLIEYYQSAVNKIQHSDSILEIYCNILILHQPIYYWSLQLTMSKAAIERLQRILASNLISELRNELNLNFEYKLEEREIAFKNDKMITYLITVSESDKPILTIDIFNNLNLHYFETDKNIKLKHLQNKAENILTDIKKENMKLLNLYEQRNPDKMFDENKLSNKEYLARILRKKHYSTILEREISSQENLVANLKQKLAIIKEDIEVASSQSIIKSDALRLLEHWCKQTKRHWKEIELQ